MLGYDIIYYVKVSEVGEVSEHCYLRTGTTCLSPALL